MKQNLKNYTSLVLFTVCASAANYAYSASFHLRENNAALIGMAMAGSAANPNDAASMFNNPASMTSLNDHAVALSVIAISPSFKFNAEQASTPTYGIMRAQSINNTGSSDGGRNAVVPSLYALWNIERDLKFGISFTTPFGLRTEYDRNWIGRYYAIKSDLKTYNINPALAYKVSDVLSVGIGVQIQRIEATLSKAIFTGNQNNDAVAEIKGSGWSVGGNAGLYYEPEPGLRFGIAYRSQVHHDVKGSINFDNRTTIPALIAKSLPLSGATAKTAMTLPETVTFSVSEDVDPQLTIAADLQWTHWSRLKELRVNFPTGGSDQVNHFGYKDTWFISIGTNYKYDDQWKLKFGLAYDATPTRNDYRDPRIPDANRIWFATGIEYMNCEDLKFSLDYAFIKLNTAKIDLAGPTVPGTPDSVGILRGDYKAYTHLLGIRAHLKF